MLKKSLRLSYYFLSADLTSSVISYTTYILELSLDSFLLLTLPFNYPFEIKLSFPITLSLSFLASASSYYLTEI